jgi:hypothetical protein
VVVVGRVVVVNRKAKGFRLAAFFFAFFCSFLDSVVGVT